MTKQFLFAGAMTLIAAVAAAQTPPTSSPSVLTTGAGHEANVSVQHYDYVEPGTLNISIHGVKVGAEYTGAFTLGESRSWFGKINLRGTVGNAAYDGWCLPWQIVPSSTSANGYRLTLGTASTCSESGDADWYVEGRALVGKDITGRSIGVSPFTGIGLRHLSNGTTGTPNFRTDEYLYVPVGLTVRARTAPDRAIGVTVEYDKLIRGWQKTRNSLLGGGTIPATATTPSFAIGDFTDFSFDQRNGWALRASASYPVTRALTVEPYYVRWRVGDSPVMSGSVAYAVNGITARQTLNAYEPLNMTNEFGVKIGIRFGGR